MGTVDQGNSCGPKYISEKDLQKIVEEVQRLRAQKAELVKEPKSLTESLAEVDRELLELEKNENAKSGYAADSTCDPSPKFFRKLKSQKPCKKSNFSAFSSTQSVDDPVHLDPVTVTKILVLQKKITNTLYKISQSLDKIPLPDGEHDLNRRQRRVAEFSIRLSRNYLYELNRLSIDIDRQIKLTFENLSPAVDRRTIIFNVQLLEQKLVNAHQLLLHALSAYCNHIPTSVLRGQPGKLTELLQTALQLRTFCNDVTLVPNLHQMGDRGEIDLNKDVENKCAEILSKFEEQSRTKAIDSSVSRKSSCRKLGQQLSMYSIRSFQQPKGFLRNKKSLMVRNKKSSLSLKSSDEILRVKKVKQNGAKRVHVAEDNIRTMVEGIPLEFVNKNCNYNEEIDRLADLSRKNKYFNDRNKKSCYSIENIKNRDYLYSFVPIVGDILSSGESQDLVDKKLVAPSGNMQLINLAYEPKIQEIPKPKKKSPIKLEVSDKTRAAFLNHREQFRDAVKDDPMYATHSANKPWDLISWISERLTDGLIAELCRDLQMSEVIDQLYELEFREF